MLADTTGVPRLLRFAQTRSLTIAMRGLNDDPHKAFIDGIAATRADDVAHILDAFFDELAAAPEPSCTRGGAAISLADNVVLVIVGDTPKNSYAGNPDWEDGSASNWNLMYLRSNGFTIPGWFGATTPLAGTGWNPARATSTRQRSDRGTRPPRMRPCSTRSREAMRAPSPASRVRPVGARGEVTLASDSTSVDLSRADSIRVVRHAQSRQDERDAADERTALAVVVCGSIDAHHTASTTTPSPMLSAPPIRRIHALRRRAAR